MATVQDIAIPDSAARTAAALDDLQDMQGEKMVLNMGPSHPATHGVLRIVLELDGELITKAEPDVGFLHRGDEKIAENMTYTQFIPYTDRLDYLAPLASNVGYALAVEKLLGIHDKLPPRCQYIRVMCAELARISAHLLGLGAFAMDMGAVTVFLLTFTEREKIYNLAEALCGARFTTSYTRIGGVMRDLPPGWLDQCRKFLEEVIINLNEMETLLTRNRIWVDRVRDLAVISKADAISYGLSGPEFARQRHRIRFAQESAVSLLQGSGFRHCGRLDGRLLRPLSGSSYGRNARPERPHSASMHQKNSRRRRQQIQGADQC